MKEAERRCRELLEGPAGKMADLWLVLADIVNQKPQGEAHTGQVRYIYTFVILDI